MCLKRTHNDLGASDSPYEKGKYLIQHPLVLYAVLQGLWQGLLVSISIMATPISNARLFSLTMESSSSLQHLYVMEALRSSFPPLAGGGKLEGR